MVSDGAAARVDSASADEKTTDKSASAAPRNGWEWRAKDMSHVDRAAGEYPPPLRGTAVPRLPAGSPRQTVKAGSFGLHEPVQKLVGVIADRRIEHVLCVI